MSEPQPKLQTFQSYDWKPGDEVKRASVGVRLGESQVVAITPSDSGKMVDISFKSPNKYPIHGWAVSESDVHKRLEEAHQVGETVQFRIESTRKPNVPREYRISQNMPGTATVVDDKERIVRVVGVAPLGAKTREEWLWSNPITNPNEDSKFMNPGSAFDTPVEKLNPQQAPVPASAQYGGYEAPAFKTHNNDGVFNLGGAAVQAVTGVLSFMREHLNKQEVTLSEEDTRRVVHALINSASFIQSEEYKRKGAIYPKPEIFAGSHTRIRGVMLSIISDVRPITQKDAESVENIKAWLGEVEKLTRESFSWSAELAEAWVNN